MKIPIALILVLLTFAACVSPRAAFEIETDQDKLVAPVEVSFQNVSENAESFEWDFGDGRISNDTTPSHRYLASGRYQIRLLAMKGNKRNQITKEIIVEAPEICLVEIATEHGNMLVQLYDETPLHRDNFVKLAEDEFYDGLLFHRVIDGFMIQGGDPDSRDAPSGKMLGMGGPGYQVDAELEAPYMHVKGALAAARMGDQVNPEKKSSGSQFYIVQGRPVSEAMLAQIEQQNGVRYTEEQKQQYLNSGGTPFLDGNYTVFGQVIEGLDVIDKIASVATGKGDRPRDNVSMRITVIK